MAKNTNNLYDRAFRQKIVNLDQGSLAELVGTLASGVEVKVVENTKETYYAIVPIDPSSIDVNVLGNLQAAGGYGALSGLTVSTLAGGPR